MERFLLKDHRGQVEFEELVNILRENTGEDEDRGLDAPLSQLNSFVRNGDTEVRRTQFLKLAGNGYGPVAIGVGLDDTQDADPRGDPLLYLAIVEGQRLQINLCVGGPP